MGARVALRQGQRERDGVDGQAARPRKLVPASVEDRARKLLEGRAELEAAPEVRPVRRGVLRVEQQAVKEKISAALRRLHPMD